MITAKGIETKRDLDGHPFISQLSDEFNEVLFNYIQEQQLDSDDFWQVLNKVSEVYQTVDIDDALGMDGKPEGFDRRAELNDDFERATYDEVKKQNLMYGGDFQCMLLKSFCSVMFDLKYQGYDPKAVKEYEEQQAATAQASEELE